MQPYTLENLLVLLEEGIKFVDLENLSINDTSITNNINGQSTYENALMINCTIRIPLTKLREISYAQGHGAGSPVGLIYGLVDPRLQDYSKQISFQAASSWALVKGNAEFSCILTIPSGEVARLSRDITDNKFYGALEMALNDRPTE